MYFSFIPLYGSSFFLIFSSSSFSFCARQGASLSRQQGSGEDYQRIVIGPHTLFGEYPPKNPEAEIKPINETGEIVLNKVVIPEYIVVHDGPIGDTSTKNRFLRELIEKAVYTKNAKNTWKNGDDISFTLDIYPKIQQK